MELLIFSDSHGKGDAMERALDLQVGRPDGIFFLGDGVRDLDALTCDAPLYAVRGNCDWFCTGTEEELLVSLCGHTILVTHGHPYAVKSTLTTLTMRAARLGADIVLYGHTHQRRLDTVEAGTRIGDVMLSRPLYLFNPGSIGYDRSFGTLVLRPDCVFFAHGSL